MCMSLCEHKFSTALGKYQGAQLLDCMMSIFSFVRNYQPVQSAGTILHSHHQWMRVPIAPYPHQHLVLLVFQILAILIYVQYYLTVVLICSSLMICDTEHLFKCSLAICKSSLVKYLFRSFTNFLIGLFIFLWLSFKNFCMFWIIVFYPMCLSHIFSPILWLDFSFSWQCLSQSRSF